MGKRSILVVDDEKDIQKLLQYNLEREGYEVRTAGSGEQGLESARQRRPDLVILDLMLPGMDGLEVCRLLRSETLTRSIPILMLTAKNSEVDQVVGLELGACDYITKPFSVKVLLARVRNIFRAREPKPGEAVLRAGGVVLDKERLECVVKGKPLALTKLEFRLFGFLMEHPGRVFSRDELLNAAWGGEVCVVDRTVDVHIRSIRKKLGKHRSSVQTLRGFGYRFVE